MRRLQFIYQQRVLPWLCYKMKAGYSLILCVNKFSCPEEGKDKRLSCDLAQTADIILLIIRGLQVII